MNPSRQGSKWLLSILKKPLKAKGFPMMPWVFFSAPAFLPLILLIFNVVSCISRVFPATFLSGGRGSHSPASERELQSGPGGLGASTSQRRIRGTLLSSGWRATDCEAGERSLTGDLHSWGKQQDWRSSRNLCATRARLGPAAALQQSSCSWEQRSGKLQHWELRVLR